MTERMPQPGFAPIPDESTNRPLFSAVPPEESPSARIVAPKKAGAAGAVAAAALQSFGARYDGLAGSAGVEVETLPTVEFDRVQPVAIQFYQDPSVGMVAAPAGNAPVGPAEPGDYVYTYSTVQTDPDQDPAATPALAVFAMNDAPTQATRFYFAQVDAAATDPQLSTYFFEHAKAGALMRLTWQGGTSVFRTLDLVVSDVVEHGDYLEIVSVDAGVYEPNGDGDALQDGQNVDFHFMSSPPAAPLPPNPPHNAAVRARVTYSAGTAGNLQFDCDWAGGLVVHAKKLSVARVAYPLDSRIAYRDDRVSLALTVCPAAPHSPHAPSFTVLPVPVAANATRVIAVPALARRLSLLCLYEVGDAKLATMHVAFVSRRGVALHWIDALSARAALFGEGVAIPPGTATLALSNRSADAGVQLGAVFHLSF